MPFDGWRIHSQRWVQWSDVRRVECSCGWHSLSARSNEDRLLRQWAWAHFMLECPRRERVQQDAATRQHIHTPRPVEWL